MWGDGMMALMVEIVEWCLVEWMVVVRVMDWW